MVQIDRNGIQSDWHRLQGSDRWFLALQVFSGLFLGSVAFFMPLSRLNNAEQTLLLSPTVPI